MKSLNDLNSLFGTGETIEYIYLDQLVDFKNHPFKVIHNEEMDRLIESVKLNGVFSPIIVRAAEEKNKFEIIAGHRRTYASRAAGLKKIPAIIKEMTDDEAIIAMVDTNNQREDVSLSEKAFAYKMKMEAMKRKAGRPTKDNSCQVGTNLRTDEIIAADATDSARQIQRYIRLTNLLPRLLELVDSGTIKFNPAVQLSYLSPEAQENLLSVLDYEEKYQISLSVANKLRKSYEAECYSYEDFSSIIYPKNNKENKEEKYFSFKLQFDIPYNLHGLVREEDIKRIVDNYIAQVGRRA